MSIHPALPPTSASPLQSHHPHTSMPSFFLINNLLSPNAAAHMHRVWDHPMGKGIPRSLPWFLRHLSLDPEPTTGLGWPTNELQESTCLHIQTLTPALESQMHITGDPCSHSRQSTDWAITQNVYFIRHKHLSLMSVPWLIWPYLLPAFISHCTEQIPVKLSYLRQALISVTDGSSFTEWLWYRSKLECAQRPSCWRLCPPVPSAAEIMRALAHQQVTLLMSSQLIGWKKQAIGCGCGECIFF